MQIWEEQRLRVDYIVVISQATMEPIEEDEEEEDEEVEMGEGSSTADLASKQVPALVPAS